MGIERAKVDAGLALLAESLAIADKATATAACTLIKEVPEPHARRLQPETHQCLGRALMVCWRRISTPA